MIQKILNLFMKRKENDPTVPGWIYPIPKNLNEAVDRIYNNLSEEEKEALAKEGFGHHGGGTFIRNSWGLWHDSVLAKWFWKTHRIWHADDMSGIIFTAVEAKLEGIPFDIGPELERYYKHWEHYGTPRGTRPKN